MFGGGLRARLFQAIGVVVLICVALTIGVGVVLTRRAVERATLRDLAHQADLIAASQRGGIGSLRSLQPRIQVVINRQSGIRLIHGAELAQFAK